MAAGSSIQTGVIPSFSIEDYVVFSFLLAVNSAIGIFYAVKDKIQRKENTTEFLLGGRNMNPILVALSVAVTFISSMSLLGNPTEIYVHNTMYMYFALSMMITSVSCALIFIPFFHRLGITTTSEYIENRFGRGVRLVTTIILLFKTVSYMGFVLYVPSLALSAVTELDLWGTIFAVGAIVTVYTSLGGMKAVLWTDAVQCVVILIGIIVVLVRGIEEAGSFSNAWAKAEETGRVLFDDFSADPRTRHSVWSVLVGGTVYWTVFYGVNQAQVQRCLATRTVRKAQIAVLLSSPVVLAMMMISFFIGITMYHFYSQCHPEKLITKNDQLLPLYVMDIVGNIKGMPGLFVAALYSGSLSSLSSGLNAVTALTFKDFIEPYCCVNLTEFKATVINKVLVAAYGIAGMVVAILAGQVDGVLQLGISIFGFFNGPLLGVFCLAMFLPWANKRGALIGMIVAILFVGWIIVGAYIYKVSTAVKAPLSTANCPWNKMVNITLDYLTNHSLAYNVSHIGGDNDLGDRLTQEIVQTTMSSVSATPSVTSKNGTGSTKQYDGILGLYSLSYFYYTPVGMIVTIIVGLIVSFITGPTDVSALDPRLICPVFDILFPYLPDAVLIPLRFGINHEKKYEKCRVVDAPDMCLDIISTPPDTNNTHNLEAETKNGLQTDVNNKTKSTLA